MDYAAFKKLVAFFSALKASGFKTTLAEIPNFIKLGGVKTPVDKNYCLKMLRLIPELQSEEYKDDNALVRYLSDQKNRDRILSRFSFNLRAELEKVLAREQLAEVGKVAEENIEAPTPEGKTAGTTAEAPAAAPPPSTPALSNQPQIIIQKTTTDSEQKTQENKVAAVSEETEEGQPEKAGQETLDQPAKLPEITQAGSSPVSERPGNKIVIPAVKSPNWLKNLGSGSGVFFQRHAGKYLTSANLARMVSGGIGAIAMGGLSGGNPVAALGGAGLGAAFPSWLKSGGGQTLGRIGSGTINAGANLSDRVSRGSNAVSGSKTKKWLLIILGVIFFMALLSNYSGTSTEIPTTEAAPVVSSDISSCKFIRSGDAIKELMYKSPLLISYMQEASNLTGIPSVVLAAFIRVETPSTVVKTDDEIRALSSIAACPRSETGALGVMQLQPKGTVGHDQWAIANGAKLIGKQYEELTEEDYCDVKKNIIMGAGFILKKMSYSTPDYPISYGDGTKWDPSWTNNKGAIEKLVSGYYGCLKYGSADDTKTPCSDPTRIYSYGDDVWNSIQNCRVSGSPVPLPSGDLHQAIMDKFRINMDASLSLQQLTWTWQILAQAEANTPKFFPLLNAKYSLIKVIVWSGMGQRIGDTIYLSNAPGTFFAAGGENEFKQILIHELGHIIHGERDDPTYTALIENAIALDKDFLTGYAQGATAHPTVVCNQADSGERAVQLDEDFAESIAYYINKNIPSELNYSNKCPPKNKQNPFKTGKYPNHLKLMQEVLGGSF